MGDSGGGGHGCAAARQPPLPEDYAPRSDLPIIGGAATPTAEPRRLTLVEVAGPVSCCWCGSVGHCPIQRGEVIAGPPAARQRRPSHPLAASARPTTGRSGRTPTPEMRAFADGRSFVSHGDAVPRFAPVAPPRSGPAQVRTHARCPPFSLPSCSLPGALMGDEHGPTGQPIRNGSGRSSDRGPSATACAHRLARSWGTSVPRA